MDEILNQAKRPRGVQDDANNKEILMQFARHPQILIGKQVSQYNVESYVNSGTYGHVYRVKHRKLDSIAAMKMLRPELFTIEKNVEEFEKEARLFASLNHPGILKAYDFGTYNFVPFFITPLITDGSLSSTGNFSLEQVIDYVTQVAQALQYAHDNKIVHRDLKPGNLLKGRYGLLLADFGIAVPAHSLKSMSEQNVCGTPEFMAPEQFDGFAQAASDQYSLGGIAYRWLAQKPLFASAEGNGNMAAYNYMHHMNLVPLIEGFSESVNAVIQKALAKTPEERFGSISEFAEALRRYA